MHPAYSVILFTTASGAGYGLLFWLALSALLSGANPAMIGWLGFGCAFALVTVGLLSSTAHLGRPERAWRAFSQWRTSWLSREGILAIATYLTGGLFAGWWLFGPVGSSPTLRLLALLAAACALGTVACTGMIYASLPTIRAWHNRLVVPVYVLLALATGRLLLNALLASLAGSVSTRAVWLVLLLLLAAWIAKAFYWSSIDDAPRDRTAGDATGLGRLGRVRPLDPPHTQPNFVMREMGYAVARKHAERLRQLVIVALFAVPALASLLMLLGPGGWLSALLAWIAVASSVIGVLVERWLFFAEAEHVAMLFYGRDAA